MDPTRGTACPTEAQAERPARMPASFGPDVSVVSPVFSAQDVAHIHRRYALHGWEQAYLRHKLNSVAGWSVSGAAASANGARARHTLREMEVACMRVLEATEKLPEDVRAEIDDLDVKDDLLGWQRGLRRYATVARTIAAIIRGNDARSEKYAEDSDPIVRRLTLIYERGIGRRVTDHDEGGRDPRCREFVTDCLAIMQRRSRTRKAVSS